MSVLFGPDDVRVAVADDGPGIPVERPTCTAAPSNWTVRLLATLVFRRPV